ncbi:hypothetical protein BDN70DRAFT_849033 [Pholiota conissans]|uniref:Allergen n=1 Tax=Pholiota conissans TaxID=109636 RepID=A0A9P5ZBR6_9AGAR|nr:hypothetical protein BDN70DRAFT_849033 [Pholiota conissans]
MGIGTTMKNMLGSETEAEHEARLGKGTTSDAPGSTTARSAELTNNPSNVSNTSRTNRLPAGTGPGTSGKADPVSTDTRSGRRATELADEQEWERSRAGGTIEGYGTDAAAAAGGSLSASHQATGIRHSHSPSTKRASGVEQGVGGTTLSNAPQSGLGNVTQTTTGTMSMPTPNIEGQRSAAISEGHQFGHSRINAKDAMPTANSQEDTNQLKPVTHERVRHLETEEVSRVKDLERHIHHIQHHTQPVVASEVLPEQVREQLHPVTLIKEKHANKPEDHTLFEGQVFQNHDTLSHGAKERTVIDKGTTINEHVHHHVHHVIQPVIEKETIEKQVIHTTVPIHEITHEAPVVHQSQTHAPVPLEHFLSRGGSLSGAVSQEEIGSKVLNTGQCAREVEGVAEKLERDLNLAPSDLHKHTHLEETSRPVVSSRN